MTTPITFTTTSTNTIYPKLHYDIIPQKFCLRDKTLEMLAGLKANISDFNYHLEIIKGSSNGFEVAFSIYFTIVGRTSEFQSYGYSTCLYVPNNVSDFNYSFFYVLKPELEKALKETGWLLEAEHYALPQGSVYYSLETKTIEKSTHVLDEQYSSYEQYKKQMGKMFYAKSYYTITNSLGTITSA